MRANGLIDAESFISPSLNGVVGITSTLARHGHFNIKQGVECIFADPRYRVVAAERNATSVSKNRSQGVQLLKPVRAQELHGDLIVLEPRWRGLSHHAQRTKAIDIGSVDHLNMAYRGPHIGLGMRCLSCLYGIKSSTHSTVANGVKVKVET